MVTHLLIETSTVLLICYLLRRTGLALPVSDTLHRRGRTLVALSSGGFGSGHRRCRCRSTCRNTACAAIRNRHARTMVVLLVRISRARRGWTLFPDRSDLSGRRERAPIRRQSCRGSLGVARPRWPGRSSARRRRSAGSGCVATSVTGSPLVRLWLGRAELRQAVRGRISVRGIRGRQVGLR